MRRILFALSALFILPIILRASIDRIGRRPLPMLGTAIGGGRRRRRNRRASGSSTRLGAVSTRSELATIAGAVTMLYATVPSTTVSSMPVMVTGCGVFQLSVVNVSEAGEATPSAGLLEETPMATSSVGWLSNTT